MSGQLKGYFMENPTDTRGILLLGKGTETTEHMIMSKVIDTQLFPPFMSNLATSHFQNSPFVPALSQGIRHLTQTGALRNIVQRWEGKIPGLQNREIEVLKGGQLLLIFVLLIFTMFASLFLLVCEIGTQKAMWHGYG